jgi:hypothetical protein
VRIPAASCGERSSIAANHRCDFETTDSEHILMVVDVGMRHRPIPGLSKDHLLDKDIVDDADIRVGQFAHGITVFIERKNFMRPSVV